MLGVLNFVTKLLWYLLIVAEFLHQDSRSTEHCLICKVLVITATCNPWNDHKNTELSVTQTLQKEAIRKKMR